MEQAIIEAMSKVRGEARADGVDLIAFANLNVGFAEVPAPLFSEEAFLRACGIAGDAAVEGPSQ